MESIFMNIYRNIDFRNGLRDLQVRKKFSSIVISIIEKLRQCKILRL